MAHVDHSDRGGEGGEREGRDEDHQGGPRGGEELGRRLLRRPRHVRQVPQVVSDEHREALRRRSRLRPHPHADADRGRGQERRTTSRWCATARPVATSPTSSSPIGGGGEGCCCTRSLREPTSRRSRPRARATPSPRRAAVRSGASTASRIDPAFQAAAAATPVWAVCPRRSRPSTDGTSSRSRTGCDRAAVRHGEGRDPQRPRRAGSGRPLEAAEGHGGRKGDARVEVRLTGS